MKKEIDIIENELTKVINEKNMGLKTHVEVITDINHIWARIKNNDELLKESITIVKDKFNERDILNGIMVSYLILLNYKDVKKEIYNALGNTILSNKDIAKLSVNGEYMITSLLSDTDFALNKNAKEFVVKMASELSQGEFDIRYYILKNKSFTLDEKKNLLYDFYEQNEYDRILDWWQWDIVNSLNGVLYILKDYLFDYNEDFFLNSIEDKKLANEIIEEIKFCKLMHSLRPTSWEVEYLRKK